MILYSVPIQQRESPRKNKKTPISKDMLAQFDHLRPPIPQTIEEKKKEFLSALGIIRGSVYDKLGGNGLGLSNVVQDAAQKPNAKYRANPCTIRTLLEAKQRKVFYSLRHKDDVRATSKRWCSGSYSNGTGSVSQQDAENGVRTTIYDALPGD